MNTWLSTLALLQAVQTFLQDLTFDGGPAVFERVEIFSEPNLVEAVMQLNLFKDRIGILVPGGDEFQHFEEGQTLRSTCDREFILLLASRNAAKREKAHSGELGSLAMKDRVIQQLHGQNLNQRPLMPQIRPTNSSHVTLSADDEKKNPGRVIWEIDFQAYCGEQQTTYNP